MKNVFKRIKDFYLKRGLERAIWAVFLLFILRFFALHLAFQTKMKLL
jgi:hypothetical protein